MKFLRAAGLAAACLLLVLALYYSTRETDHASTTPDAGGYLIVDLVGTAANRDAIGAQVELYDGAGELAGYRELGPGRAQSSAYR